MDIAVDDLKKVFGDSFFDNISKLVGNVNDIHDILTGNKSINTPDKQRNLYHRLDDPLISSKHTEQKQTPQTTSDTVTGKKDEKDNKGIISAFSKVASTLIDIPRSDKKDTSLKAVYSNQAKELEQHARFKILLEDVLNYELTSFYDEYLKPSWDKTNNTLDKICHLLESGFKGTGSGADPKKGIWNFLDDLLKDWFALKAAGGALGLLRKLLGVKEKGIKNAEEENRLAEEEETRIKEKSRAAIDDEKLINEEAKLNELRKNALSKRATAESLNDSIAEASIENRKAAAERNKAFQEYQKYEGELIEKGIIEDANLLDLKKQAVLAEKEFNTSHEKVIELQTTRDNLLRDAAQADIDAAKIHMTKVTSGSTSTEAAQTAGEAVEASTKNIAKFAKYAEAAETISKTARVLGPVALALSAGAEYLQGEAEFKKIDAMKKAGQISAEEARMQGADVVGGRSGKFVARTGFGLAGGAVGGALLGAAVGSVVPVIGTAIGGVAGGILGYMGGEKLADITGTTKLTEDIGKSIAEKVTPKNNDIKDAPKASDFTDIKEAVIDRSEAQEEWLKKLSISNDETAKNTRDLIDIMKSFKGELNGPVINNISSSSSVINTQGSTDGNAAMRRKLFPLSFAPGSY